MRSKRVFFASERMLLLWLIMANVFAVTNAALAFDIYVSVDGDAGADGSLAKPFGSLPDAVEAVRVLRKAGNTEPAVIYLREGRHQLDQTLVLGLEDGSPKSSGDATLPQYGAGNTSAPAFLTFAAHPGEHPIVSGGVPVTGWKPLDSTFGMAKTEPTVLAAGSDNATNHFPTPEASAFGSQKKQFPRSKRESEEQEAPGSPRFGQGVTEEFHLFSIELGTAAARQAEVERAT